jgi:hypothetical protein
MDKSDPELPLSPELVLVAPEFGEHALVEEPNGGPPPAADPPPVLPAPTRPAPPAALSPVLPAPTRPAPPAAEPPAERQPAGTPPEARAPAEAEARPVAPPPSSEWRLTVGGATAIVLSAIVVFGAGFLIGQYVLPESTSEPVADRQAAPQTTVAAITEIATPRPRTSSQAPRAPVAVPAPPAKPKSTPAAAPSPVPKPKTKPKPTPKTVRPIPNGGYVMPGGGGRFQVSSNGRAVTGFTLEKACRELLVLPPIAIEATGAFTFSGHPAGPSRAPTVRLQGRFVTPEEARGTAQVIGTGCSATATPFVARLS